MRILDKDAPVLVTGGSGYIASWLCKFLMEEGYHVRATFRDRKNAQKFEHLQRIDDEAPGTLEIWEADLLDPTSFDNVIDGCKVVFHVASPFVIFGAKDPENTLIKPAVEGTRTVLEAATRSGSVERVVLTSSIYALYGDNADILEAPNGKFDERSWNTSSSIHHQPYPYSKRLAEETAWKTSEGQTWDLVVLNPGFVLGPSLTTRRDSASIDFMLQMTDGRMKGGVPDVEIGVVDVRDVARAHMVAAEKGETKRRYILVAETVSFLTIANYLRAKFSHYPLPKKIAPKWLFKALGPWIGFTRKYVNRNFGYKVNYDTQPSREELGLEYRSVKDTVNDMLEEMERQGMTKSKGKKL